MASQAYSQATSRSRPPSELTLQVEALLSRYPDLGDDELETLVDIFPYLRIVDLGMMTADDELSERLEAFHREHGHRLRAPTSSLLAFLAFPALVAVGLLWWLMSSLAPL